MFLYLSAKNKPENVFQLLTDRVPNLKQLQLYLEFRDLSATSKPENVIQLLTQRRNLEHLWLELVSTDREPCPINLPNLKLVKLSFFYMRANSVLELNDNGTVVFLTCSLEAFNENVAIAQLPQNFPKLRGIFWVADIRLSEILEAFTKSQMPEIQSVEIVNIRDHNLDNLCEFIKSKEKKR